MSLATSTVVPVSTTVVPPADSDESKIENDKIVNNDVHSSSSRSLEASFNMDRQPQAPRRSISPVQRRPEEGIDTTQKAANTTLDSDGESSTVDEDLEYIARLYGGDNYIPEELNTEDLGSSSLRSSRAYPDAGDELPPPPPLRHITEHESSPKFGKLKHDYDGTREPKRSSMRNPNSKTRNVNSIDNSQHRNKEISRGITRNHSADGTKDTRRGSMGSLHSVRMRGSIYPVQQRLQSIGFSETVRVTEVTPTVELNDGNTRDLWLQEDEAMEIKERRRTLLRRYKEREARKKREAERLRQEQEKTQRQQKVKNLLNPSTSSNSNKNNVGHFMNQNAAAKKHPRWTGIGKTGGILKKPDLPLPGVASPSGRRWKANEHPMAMGLSVPSRGGGVDPPFSDLSYMGTPSSFISTSSAGSSLSGHDSDSFRGLEKYIDRSGKHQKNMVWDAVFVEQDEQLQFGYYDDERIATLYRTVQNQHDGQQKALDRARKDRKAAEKYLMTPRTMRMFKDNTFFDRAGMSNLMCNDLLEDVSTETKSKKEEKNSEKEQTDKKEEDRNGNDKECLGNHAKANSPEKSAEQNGVTSGGTTALKGGPSPQGSGSGKRYKKFLRRLSV